MGYYSYYDLLDTIYEPDPNMFCPKGEKTRAELGDTDFAVYLFNKCIETKLRDTDLHISDTLLSQIYPYVKNFIYYPSAKFRVRHICPYDMEDWYFSLLKNVFLTIKESSDDNMHAFGKTRKLTAVTNFWATNHINTLDDQKYWLSILKIITDTVSLLQGDLQEEKYSGNSRNLIIKYLESLVGGRDELNNHLQRWGALTRIIKE